MGKLKQFFGSIYTSFKKGIQKSPLTLLLICIISLYSVITLEMDLEGILGFETVIPFFIITTFGVFFSEIIFGKKLFKYAGAILATIISSFFIYLLVYKEGTLFSYDINSGIKEDVAMFCFGYIACIFLYTLYKIFIKSELNFQKFVGKIFSNVFTMTIIYWILSLGFLILTFIFNNLILDGDSWYELYPRIMILLTGLFYIPSLIVTLPKKEDTSDLPIFTKVLSLYVFLPLFIISMIIIYMYIFKIIFLDSIPSNFVFPVLSAIFGVGFVIWNLISNYTEKNKFITIITKATPYAFVPFVILQIYCVAVRYVSYGITPPRYLSYIYILFEIAAIFLMIFKKSKLLGKLFYIVIILTFLATISPINASNMSKVSQGSRMEKIIKENNMYVDNKLVLDGKDEDKVTDLISAYRYLKYEYNADKYIPSYLSDEDKNSLSSWYKTYDYKQVPKTNIHISLKIEDPIIDISNYSKMSKIRFYKYNADAIKNNEISEFIDLNAYVSELINKYDEDTLSKMSTFEAESDYIIAVNEFTVFYIEFLNFNYDLENKELTYINLDGYLLLK